MKSVFMRSILALLLAGCTSLVESESPEKKLSRELSRVVLKFVDSDDYGEYDEYLPAIQNVVARVLNENFSDVELCEIQNGFCDQELQCVLNGENTAENDILRAHQRIKEKLSDETLKKFQSDSFNRVLSEAISDLLHETEIIE